MRERDIEPATSQERPRDAPRSSVSSPQRRSAPRMVLVAQGAAVPGVPHLGPLVGPRMTLPTSQPRSPEWTPAAAPARSRNRSRASRCSKDLPSWLKSSRRCECAACTLRPCCSSVVSIPSTRFSNRLTRPRGGTSARTRAELPGTWLHSAFAARALASTASPFLRATPTTLKFPSSPRLDERLIAGEAQRYPGGAERLVDSRPGDSAVSDHIAPRGPQEERISLGALADVAGLLEHSKLRRHPGRVDLVTLCVASQEQLLRGPGVLQAAKCFSQKVRSRIQAASGTDSRFRRASR